MATLCGLFASSIFCALHMIGQWYMTGCTWHQTHVACSVAGRSALRTAAGPPIVLAVAVATADTSSKRAVCCVEAAAS
jgi:hypothetical protein